MNTSGLSVFPQERCIISFTYHGFYSVHDNKGNSLGYYNPSYDNSGLALYVPYPHMVLIYRYAYNVRGYINKSGDWSNDPPYLDFGDTLQTPDGWEAVKEWLNANGTWG